MYIYEYVGWLKVNLPPLRSASLDPRSVLHVGWLTMNLPLRGASLDPRSVLHVGWLTMNLPLRGASLDPRSVLHVGWLTGPGLSGLGLNPPISRGGGNGAKKKG